MVNKKDFGFTLIELLVVIAIIALLMAIIIPSLSLAKKKAASILCMSNARQLSIGWYMYQGDNDGNIMSAEMDGIPSGTSLGDLQGPIPGWINTPHTAASVALSSVSGSVTDEDEIRGIEDGALHPYLKSPDVFNCPADKVKSLYDTVDPEKFVTFAVPSCLAGWNEDSNGNAYQIPKFSRISSPGDRYNFIETAEERNYIAYGHFVFGGPELLSGAPAVWWSPMAVNHGDSSILGFCDGHAEVHKWQDRYTKERVVKLSELGTAMYDIDTMSGVNSSNSEDLAYMARGWAYRYKGP